MLLPRTVITPRQPIDYGGISSLKRFNLKSLWLFGARIELPDSLGMNLALDQILYNLAHLARDQTHNARKKRATHPARKWVSREIHSNQDAVYRRGGTERSLDNLAYYGDPLRSDFGAMRGAVVPSLKR